MERKLDHGDGSALMVLTSSTELAEPSETTKKVTFFKASKIFIYMQTILRS
ncbi:hypothetical protein SAMN05443253_10656 [Bacillus sp. OK048]|nr:hypothetical protein SAMN05443253_10656 [Bacillus sp. OK048]